MHKEKIEKIILENKDRYLNNELSITDLQNITNSSRGRVRHYLNKHNIKKETNYTVIDKIDLEILNYKQKYENNEITFKELKEKLKISSGVLRYRLSKLNIKKISSKDIDWKKIAELYYSDKTTMEELENKLGLKSSTIYKNISKYKKENIDNYISSNYESIDTFVYDKFINKEFTITKLANELGVGRNKLSKLVNSSNYPVYTHKYYIAKKYLIKKGCQIKENNKTLSSKRYINFVCNIHNNKIQKINYWDLKEQDYACVYCKEEEIKNKNITKAKNILKSKGYKIDFIRDNEIEFTCYEHGFNKINIGDILIGKECPKCEEILSLNNIDIYKNKNILTQLFSTLYILKAKSSTELFYIFVIDNNKLKNIRLPYSYEIIYTKKDNLYNLYWLRKNLIKYHNKYKYIPNRFFGKNEFCYEKLLIKEVN